MTLMECPKCGYYQSYVVDVAQCENGIRRRRECENCGERWTTYEFSAEVMQKFGIKMNARGRRNQGKNEQHSVSVHDREG